MKRLVWIVGCVCAGYAAVPPNAITITNHTGGPVNQPYIISRFFAAGEIPRYPRPELVQVRGLSQSIDQWQSNVKTRWPDGSVQHALISFWRTTQNGASDAIQFSDTDMSCYLGSQETCDAAGLDGPGMTGFNGGNWGAAITATQNNTTYTVDAKDLLQAGFIKYWVRGPIATVAVAEDRTPSRSKDFGWTCGDTFRAVVDPATDIFTTYDAATGTTAMPHGLVNGEKVNFGVTVSPGPQPLFGTSGKLSLARYIVNATANTFQVSLKQGGDPLDITTAGAGNTLVTSCGTTDYSTTTQWNNDTTYRSLHPQFILTFFPGWSGVYTEYVMQNGWTTAIQDQRYQVTLLKDASNSTTVRSGTITHYARTEWVYRDWSGTPTTLEFPVSSQIYSSKISPPNFSIDLNKQYIIYSKMVPQHDPRLTVDLSFTYRNDILEYQSNMTGSEPFYCQKNSSSECGNFLTVFSATGGRGDIGLNPRWYVRYLYTFDPRMYWITVGDADMAGTVPYHLWEGATGKSYDSAHKVDAFGLPLSINARPTVTEYNSGTWDTPGAAAADKFTFVDAFPAAFGAGYSLSDAYNWVPEYSQSDPQHNPAFHYIPYLTTGDYFYLEDGLAYVSQYVARTGAGQRHSDWGISTGGTRGYAWAQRGMFQMALMAPDGSPEKAYFAQKADYNLALFEAMYGIVNGSFTKTCDPDAFNAATETDPYCWSLYSRVGASSGFNLWSIPLNRNLTSAGADPTSTIASDGLFQAGFQAMVFGWGAEVGFKSDSLAHQIGRLWTQLVMTGNPRDVEQYVVPTSLIQPTAQLAANINATTLTIPLVAAPTWKAAVPFPVKLDNEYIYICAATDTTLTACKLGRGALRANPQVGFGAGSHTAGATITLTNFAPYLNNLSDFSAGLLPQNRNWSLPFTSFGDTELGYANVSLGALSFASDATYDGLSRLDAFHKLYALRIASGFKFEGTYNPKLMYLPRYDPVLGIKASISGANVVIAYRAPTAGTADAACTVDGVDDGQSNKRDRTVTKTGLTPGRDYTSMIRCVADYYDTGYGPGKSIVKYSTRGVPPLSSSK
jgi:hypothetical protein